MKTISDANRIEAITLFLEKPNTDLLSKEELIAGVQSIAGIRPLTAEAKELYSDALEMTYKGRV